MADKDTGSPARRGPPGGIDDLVKELMRVITYQLPSLAIAVISANVIRNVVRNVVDILKKHLRFISGGLIVAGLSAILPSLAVVIVNAVGFTAAGVTKASLAALIQSVVYGGSTGGVFSALQAFGATASIAHPVVLAVGVSVGLIGVGISAYRWYRNMRDRSDSSENRGEPGEKQIIRRDGMYNFFNFFRRRQ